MAQNEIVQVTDTKRHFVSLFSVTWEVLCQQSEILHAGRVSERRHAFFTPCKRGKQSIMEGKNNPNEKKRLIGLLVASITPIIIVVATIFALFGWLFRFELQSFLWPLAISFLVVDLIFWLIPDLSMLPEKRRKLIIIDRIVFSLIGGALFVVDAFLFLENKIYALMLVVIVLCLFLGLIFFKKLFQFFTTKTKVRLFIGSFDFDEKGVIL